MSPPQVLGLNGNNIVIPNVLGADDAHEKLEDPDFVMSQTGATQSTQQASQQPEMEGHLWGYLQPCSPKLTRIDFWKVKPTYKMGRMEDEARPVNDIVLPGMKISNKHCVVKWDGKDDRSSVVTILDTSSNGTFINGEKIGRNQTAIVREGNEVAFGTSQPQDNPEQDYRYIYRHMAAGVPKQGLWAFYDIAHELGKGSFATVVKAINRTDHQWYAVKMIQNANKMKRRHVPTGNGANAVQDGHLELSREIKILEGLNHRNICKLKEVFFDKDPENESIYLVLELVEGGDLLDYIVKNDGLDEEKTTHITYQICDALAYIHNKDIAHRDLKPENVLLTNDEPPVVKVADFGLAKAVDSMTMLRTMCGTPSYLAPEVVTQREQEGYDRLVDSWSVGVIVFSMLTNSSPFIEDLSERDVATRIRNRTVDWSSLVRFGVSAEGQDFIRRLLEVDPTRRMTLADARSHPWLSRRRVNRMNVPRVPVQDPSVDSLPGDGTEDDEVMVAEQESGVTQLNGATRSSSEAVAVSNRIEHLQLSGGLSGGLVVDDSAADIVSSIPGAFLQDGEKQSKAAPLQRRSKVVAQANEESGTDLPEPSMDMIKRAEAQHPGPGGTKGNKRLRSELTPMPEEETPASHQPEASSSRKKTKEGEENDESSSNQTPRKPSNARANGTPNPKGKATRARGAQVVEEEDVGKPRRSTRASAQKAARR